VGVGVQDRLLTQEVLEKPVSHLGPKPAWTLAHGSLLLPSGHPWGPRSELGIGTCSKPTMSGSELVQSVWAAAYRQGEKKSKLV
jgi:hypothetical protein